MKAIDIPAKFPIPWANSASIGYIRSIPITSQVGIELGAASLETGWVPDNFLEETAGGIAPSGKDDNGIKNQITANIRWFSAGMNPKYDSTFSTYIGGYPNGSILQKADLSGHWRSTVDDNTSNPDTGGAGWVSTTITIGIDPNTTDNTSTPASTSWVQAALLKVQTGFPVGCVVPFFGGYFTNSVNGGFTSVRGNTIAAVNALFNPEGFYVCNGAALNIPGSLIFNAPGRYLPNITDSRFIMGSSSSGGIGGSLSNDHLHSMVHIHSIVHVHTMQHNHTINHGHTTGSTIVGQNLLLATDYGLDTWDSSYDYVKDHSHGVGTITTTVSGYASDYTTSNPTNSNSGGASVSNTGYATVTENRPPFISGIMLMRVF